MSYPNLWLWVPYFIGECGLELSKGSSMKTFSIHRVTVGLIVSLLGALISTMVYAQEDFIHSQLIDFGFIQEENGSFRFENSDFFLTLDDCSVGVYCPISVGQSGDSELINTAMSIRNIDLEEVNNGDVEIFGCDYSEKGRRVNLNGETTKIGFVSLVYVPVEADCVIEQGHFLNVSTTSISGLIRHHKIVLVEK
jgi:hypothetical protein